MHNNKAAAARIPVAFAWHFNYSKCCLGLSLFTPLEGWNGGRGWDRIA